MATVKLNVVNFLGYVQNDAIVLTLWYGGNISLIKKKITNIEKQTEGRLSVVKASGKICYTERLDLVYVRANTWKAPGRFIFEEVCWFLLIFKRLSFSLRLFKLLTIPISIPKRFELRTCKVSLVRVKLETGMGC